MLVASFQEGIRNQAQEIETLKNKVKEFSMIDNKVAPFLPYPSNDWSDDFSCPSELNYNRKWPVYKRWRKRLKK